MLNLKMDQYEFMQYDFGRPTNLLIYLEDKETLFDETGYTAVIQSFKRYGDGMFFPHKDVARGLTVKGLIAQVIEDIDVTFVAKAVVGSTITNPGTNYDDNNPPSVTFQDPPGGGTKAEGRAVIDDGKLIEIVITKKGEYLTASAPTITIADPTSGTTALATSIVNSGQSVATFAFTSAKQPTVPGYLWIKIVLSKNGFKVSSVMLKIFIHPGAPQ